MLDVFLQHLDEAKAPMTPSLQMTPAIDRALMALTGILKSSSYFEQYKEVLTPKLLKAWPGVFKWSVFFAATRDLPAAPPKLRRSSSDLISGTWFSFVRADRVKIRMAETAGSIEIITKLWLEEDSHIMPPSVIDIPSASAVLDSLLRNEDYEENKGSREKPDRFLKAAGGSAKNVARLMMSRMKTVMSGPRQQAHENRTAIYLDLIGHMSMLRTHPLRHAFLSAGIIETCVKAALAATKQLNGAGSPDGGDLFGPLVASLGYLVNCIESTDGFSWIIQAVKAGLLIAFADASPHFDSIDEEEQGWLLKIITDLLPRYTVYRSVVLAIDAQVPPDNSSV